MVPTSWWRPILEWMNRSVAFRWLSSLVAITLVALLGPLLPVDATLRTAAVIVAILIAAWWGGPGPALVMGPLLFSIGRLGDGLPETSPIPSRHEIAGVAIITAIIATVGLGGQYRRRVRTITRLHSEKLREQSQALSLAHIVFRRVDGRVTGWNEGAERMFGWTSGEAVGKDLHDLLRTQFPAERSEIQAELLRLGQWQGEVIHQRKDGNELIIQSHWILYRDSDGAPIGVAEVHNDVTALRRAEEAVREADRRKDEFLALLGHELRNPLAPIRTGLELMKIASDDPETMAETREIMERQTLQLVRLVDDLMDVSRITRGKLELRRCRVALADVVRSAVEASQPFISEARHQLTLNLPDSPVELHADPHRLAQVVSNLLNNAAKFTPQAGSIGLSAQTKERDVTISVTDNGMGIPPDVQERIFEPFAQIDRSQERPDAGLGIGLTLVKTLVAMHGGTIEVQSEGLGKGSTFRIVLPLPTDAALADASSGNGVQSQSLGHGRRVLVVDDNEEAASLLSRVMQIQGNEVRTASDGQEAIEIAEHFLPEVVLMDLGMPRMDGYEAAKHMRRRPWGREVLLVAVTGCGQETDRQRTREAGFDHHLAKPAKSSQLQELIAELEGKRG